MITIRPSSITALIALGLLVASDVSQAESTYGYDPAGTATRTARARLNITVTVPKLILLRVGSSGGTVDTVNLGATFSSGIPGGIPSPLTDGNDLPSGWDGTAPVMATNGSGSVQAWAWTNAIGGGQLTSAVTTPFPVGSGLNASNITVSSTPVGATGLAHPGANTATSTPTNFVKNVVATSTWTFSVAPAVLAGVAGGTNTQVMTYTATTL